MIMDLNQLPFKVGQHAESKSFTVGFRSAWFRCKIKNISLRKGQIGLSLEFFDYPGEKVSWTKLYQKSPQEHIASHEESKLVLMVRPSFPPIYRESQLPGSSPESVVIAIVSETWKVGDLVDWWSDHCYWSGKVIQLLGNDKVQIELPEPPIGEGKSYEALCKDLRPSLDWSPENGWTVPVSRENGNCWYCAHLIQPNNQDNKSKDKCARVESPTVAEINDPNMVLKSGSPSEQKPNCLDEVSKSLDEVKDASDVHTNLPCRKDRYNSLDSIKNKWIRESKYIASQRCPDTLESSIVELEEVANKIRWLKGFLQYGFQWSNAMKPSWRFLENYGPYKKR